MPQYYFHVHAEDCIIPDEEGMLLPDLASAKREALLSIKDMTAEAGFADSSLSTERIDVANDEGTVVLTVPFSEARKLAS